MEAARILRGIDQRQLGELFAADGLGKSDPGRIERGQIPLDNARLAAACRHLRVPESWFTAESVDDVVGLTPTGETAELLAERALEAARELLQARSAGDGESR